MDLILDTTFNNDRLPVDQPVPELIWSDNFNRADGAPGNTPVGNRAWIAVQTWNIVSQQMARSAVSGVGYLLVNAGKADGTLKATIAVQGADRVAGIAFRYADADNNLVLAARVSGGDNRYRLVKRVAGTVSQITVLTQTSADGDVIEINGNGTTITIKINGVQAWQGTVADFATATSHGLYRSTASTNDTRFDDASWSAIPA